MGSRRALVAGLVVVTFAAVVIGVGFWRLVDGIRNPTVGPLPERADAVVVFAGEDRRFELGRQLVEEGRAPVLVLSASRLPPMAEGWCDEELTTFEVVCVIPESSSTAAEATVFARLARDREWGALLGVTGDYHAQRASMLLSRCFGGTASWSVVDWPTPPWALTRSEATKTLGDWLLSHEC